MTDKPGPGWRRFNAEKAAEYNAKSQKKRNTLLNDVAQEAGFSSWTSLGTWATHHRTELVAAIRELIRANDERATK